MLFVFSIILLCLSFFFFYPLSLVNNYSTQINCKKDYIKVDLNLNDSTNSYPDIYLENLKDYPVKDCQAIKEGNRRSFHFNLKEFHQCGLTKSKNLLTVSKKKKNNFYSFFLLLLFLNKIKNKNFLFKIFRVSLLITTELFWIISTTLRNMFISTALIKLCRRNII